LFHRVILLSGTLLSPSALAQHPEDVTAQVSRQMKCGGAEESLADCLRKKTVEELLAVKVSNIQTTQSRIFAYFS
jgi:carboxylesterase type B